MILNHRQRQISDRTAIVTVPNDPVSKLRYFLYCISNVVPGVSQFGNLSEIIKFQRPLNLNDSQIEELARLCEACFVATSENCIFRLPQLQGANRFVSLREVNSTLAISEQIFIAGQRQKVTEVMFYNDIWLERNLITPLKEVKLLKLKKQQTVDAIMRQAMDEYINERKAELYQLQEAERRRKEKRRQKAQSCGCSIM